MSKLIQDIFDEVEEKVASNRLVLPSLPEGAQKVRTMSASDNCSSIKLARVIEIYARRLQTQETMTAQIA